MIFLSALIAIISSVMQNTGAAVLFLPGIQHACKEIKQPVSSILMPIGMCAILGGTLTMIGTSPLILLNDILPDGMEKFGLLELTPIGAGSCIGGIIYFSTVGKVFLNKIVKAQQSRTGRHRRRRSRRRTSAPTTTSWRAPSSCRCPRTTRHPPTPPRSIVEHPPPASGQHRGHRRRPGTHRDLAPSPDVKIQPGYNLCVYGPSNAVQDFAEEYGIKILERPLRFRELFNPAVAGTVEAVVSPRSAMIGSTVKEIGFRKTFGVTVLALYREGKTYYTRDVRHPAAPGDALLLHSTWEHFHVLQEAHRNFTIITPLEVEIQKPSKAMPAVDLLPHGADADAGLQLLLPEAALQPDPALGLPDAGRPGHDRSRG